MTCIILTVSTVGFYAWNVRVKISEPKGPCTSAADCSPGTTCLAGVCVGGGCSPGNPCLQHQKCLSGACVGGGCAHNTDCPEAQTCVSGVCVGGCQNDEACPSGDRCTKGACIAQSCNWTNEKCPLGQHCFAGLCRAGGCQNSAECSSQQTCINGACVGGGCYVNGDCPRGQTCKDKTCVGGCQTKADCPSGQSCIKGRCRPVIPCAAATDCPAGAICQEQACIPAPPCPPTLTISPKTSFWMQNKKIGPTLAVSTRFTETPVMSIPNPGLLAPLSHIQATPAEATNEYYLYIPIMNGKTPSRFYLTRDATHKSLRYIVVCLGSSDSCVKKYDPASVPNARWLFEGGVLSDPEKTTVLSAAPCTAVPAPYACRDSVPSLTAGPFLTTYGASDCLNDSFIWQFATPTL